MNAHRKTSEAAGLSPDAFVSGIKAALVPLADPANAKPMAAYMKGHFPFLGIKTADRRAATKAIVRAQSASVIASAEALWRLPEREYQYIACDLLDRHAGALPAAALPQVLKLVTQKSWWDTVDALAKVAGAIVRNHPALAPRMDRLATDKNMWLRRIAILHQNAYKQHTDVERLFRVCLLNAADPEFFIRKAIGWALREHAHHDPETIRRFLREHGDKLSPLTRREAAKHL
jgi:3-methyladenine DNA glycosylase AlkD